MFIVPLLRCLVGGLIVGVGLAFSVPAAAQSRPDARAHSVKKPKPNKPVKGKKGRAPDADEGTAKEDAMRDVAADAEAEPPARAADESKASGVKAAGTTAPAAATSATTKAVKSVKEEASAAGVKTYEFRAVEVEGRLRSPQILYFLRRVRAEFDAAALGHRSFLRELAHTRNDSAFR
jgi:hypothetical protein